MTSHLSSGLIVSNVHHLVTEIEADGFCTLLHAANSCFFYSVSIATHCHISVITYTQGSVWIYRPESKPSHSSVCFHLEIKAFTAPTVANDTQLFVIKLPCTFLPFCTAFSFLPDDLAGSLMFLCLSQVNKEERRWLMCAYLTAGIQCKCLCKMRAMSNKYIHIQCTLTGNLMRLPPGRARPVYEYWWCGWLSAGSTLGLCGFFL